ncbi:MAG: LPS-assembly protein LptD [Candidatus Omnitrophica bacterium]|nr:LPS-assembly protein LptD [Candidatus Omnitrophota bacterium]
MKKNKPKKTAVFIFLAGILLFLGKPLFSAEDTSGGQVELNGDTVEYSIDGNKINAKGNVVVIYNNARLSCDEVEFLRNEKLAFAKGDVVLSTEGGTIKGRNIIFNFESMTGEFYNAKFYSYPYYGEARKVSRLADKHLVLENGYVTTSDYDDPGYRLRSRKIDIFPGERMTARGVKTIMGRVPVMYFPKVSQNLRDSKAGFSAVPGYDKEWGMFILTKKRYFFNEGFKGAVRFDAREKKDLAWGVDVDYKTPQTGEGLVRTYYMNERSITSNRFYQERPSPTIERERFKAEWRHKWKLDEKTSAIMQYYKISDATFLKDYFERHYQSDSSPNTYFLLTRPLPQGLASLRVDSKVNRFNSEVERLPELRYDLPDYKIASSNFYYKNTSIYSNLVNRLASPTEVRPETRRFDTDNEIAYPFKFSFLEFRPYVAERYTYYSRTLNPEDYNSVRSIFRTGSSLSTKFYRIYDVYSENLGIEINRLRHIVTPSVSYQYIHEPTLSSNQIDYFDEIDSKTRGHAVTFALENKLQTKRNEQTVELLRVLTSSPFNLKENPGAGSFQNITNEIDFKPNDLFTFYFDSLYDSQRDHLSTANFDMYINGKDKWSIGVGKRWDRDVDDQITTNVFYRFNPKWAVKAYQRYDLKNGILKEQDYVLTRDLHSWEMNIDFNQTRGEGSEILLLFTLKGFPDIGIEAGSSFNRKKAGSQSGEGI